MTGRYLGGERRDLTVSYVRSSGFMDLNNYDQFYGNLRNPIVRPNEHNLIPDRRATSAPGSRHHRVARPMGLRSGARGPFGIPVVCRRRVPGLCRRAQPRRTPAESEGVRLLTLPALARLKKYRFRGGIRVYNIFGASAERDVQSNIASPSFGQFFNPIERSIGFVIGSAK